MRACRRMGAIALLLLTATGFPARARAEPEHIRIQFSAPKRCPDGTAFVRALHQRTGRFQFVSGNEQTRIFVVTITHADSLFSGRLEIQGPGMETSLRKVSGTTCDEVMSALALMTALAIDPSALTPSVPSPTAQSPAGPSNRTPSATAVSPIPPPASTAEPLASTPSTRPPSSTTDRREDSNPPRKTPAQSPAAPPPMTLQTPSTPPSMGGSEHWKWSAGVHGGVSLGMSPTTGLGGLLFVEAAAPGAAVLGPVLRTGLFLNQSDVTLASGAGAEFQWAAAMVEGCPIRLVALDARVALYPCVAFHLGVLRGQGRHLDRPEETANLWSDLGPVARIRVAVFARLFLEAQGMLVLPLRRLTFDVQAAGPTQPTTTVFSVPSLGALAGIGVSYEFR